jgi:phosphohistidine phosphatase SixA
MRIRALFTFILVALGAAQAPLAAQDEDVVVFLVRHGEVEPDGTSDPHLSDTGRERAQLLATIMRDAGVTHLHSTNLNRTRQTGEALGADTGLDISLYDYRDLPGFAQHLAATSGRHVVLGHSNTTPDVVAALGGEPGTPINELEFDRLYVVTLHPDGTSTTVLLRYGTPYGG